MPESPGASSLPEGPASTRVPQLGVPGRLAVVIAVGALGVTVALGLAGQGDGQPRPSPAEFGVSTAVPTAAVRTATPTRDREPAATEVALPDRPCMAVAPTSSTPLPDVAAAVPGDDGSGPAPLGTVDDVPNEDRLDFLFEGPGCFRDAHFIDPVDPGRGSGPWVAGRPFHVREGFINNGVLPLEEGFDVVLYVTRMADGPEPTYRLTSDYVLRGAADRCGPTYRTQSKSETCEWFVHDFPDGLPEGRFAIWAAWEAPCGAWVDLGLADSCVEPGRVTSLFSSGFDSPYGQSEPDYSETSAY